jgi:hypothetical protein
VWAFGHLVMSFVTCDVGLCLFGFWAFIGLLGVMTLKFNIDNCHMFKFTI